MLHAIKAHGVSGSLEYPELSEFYLSVQQDHKDHTKDVHIFDNHFIQPGNTSKSCMRLAAGMGLSDKEYKECFDL